MPLPQDMSIPALRELAECRIWIAWKPVLRNGKFEKVPHDPKTSVQYNHLNSTNWLLYDELAKIITASKDKKLEVGIVFDASNPYCGIDLDKGYKDGKFILPEHETYIKYFSSYTEFSPSKTGFHILIKGKRPPGFLKKTGSVEIYDEKRFFTVTGVHYDKSPQDIKLCQEELAQFLETHFEKTKEYTLENLEDFPLVFDYSAKAPREKFDILRNNNTKFAMSWDHKRKDMTDQSASGYDYSLMYWAIAAEWEPQEIYNLLIEHRRDVCGTEHVAKIQDVSPRGLFKREYPGCVASVKHNYGDVSPQINRVMALGEEECLKLFADETGQKIDKVIMGGANPARFYFQIGKHLVDLGESKQLMRLNDVRGQLYEFTGKYIRDNMKKQQWLRLCEMLYDIAERRNEKIMTKSFVTLSFADAYLRDRGNATGEDWRGTAMALKPFLKKYRGDGDFGGSDYLFLSLQEFRKYLWIQHNTKIGTQDCIRDLTECGFKNIQFSFRYENNPYCRSFWKIKMEEVINATNIPRDGAAGDREDDASRPASDFSDREIWEQIDPNMQPDKSSGTRDSGEGDTDS